MKHWYFEKAKWFFNTDRLGDLGQAQMLTPVIIALWEAEVSGLLEPKSLRPAWTTWWNPLSEKNTNNSPGVVTTCL